MAEGQSPTEDLRCNQRKAEAHLDSVQVVRMGSNQLLGITGWPGSDFKHASYLTQGYFLILLFE